jgi:hypothetical protein
MPLTVKVTEDSIWSKTTLSISCPFGTIPSTIRNNTFLVWSFKSEQLGTIRGNSKRDVARRCAKQCALWPKGTHMQFNRRNGQPEMIGSSPRRFVTIWNDSGRFSTIHAKQSRARCCDAAQNNACSMARQGPHMQFKRRNGQLGPSRDNAWQLGTRHSVVPILPRLQFELDDLLGLARIDHESHLA